MDPMNAPKELLSLLDLPPGWDRIQFRELGQSRHPTEPLVCLAADNPLLQTNGMGVWNTESGALVRWLPHAGAFAWFATGTEVEWGYDLFEANPLRRVGGIDEDRFGYMLDLPTFSDDESRLLLGYGESWLGGWWAHPDDDPWEPARGGTVTLGMAAGPQAG